MLQNDKFSFYIAGIFWQKFSCDRFYLGKVTKFFFINYASKDNLLAFSVWIMI